MKTNLFLFWFVLFLHSLFCSKMGSNFNLLSLLNSSSFDTVVYNKKYMFGLSSFWHRAIKTR